VKVTPGQQLILASEAGPRNSSGSMLEALGMAATGALVKRMTVVASRPDATLVLLQDDVSSGTGAASNVLSVNAHYVDPDDPLSLRKLLPASSASTQVVARSRAAPSSSYLRPAELYARAQASFGDALKGVHIDVLA
jgi:hypothetical protein